MLERPFFKLIALTAALVLLIVFTHEVSLPIERALLGPYLGGGVLFYLPLGFWVLVAYYERWCAAIYLAPGLAIGLMFYGHPDLSPLAKALQLLVMSTAAPLVFAVLSWANGRPNTPSNERFAWRLILVAGGVTAIINSLGLNLVRHELLPHTATVAAVMKFSVGGFVGLLSCLFLLAIAFRVSRQIPVRW